jgi:spore maturation protein CgeB
LPYYDLHLVQRDCNFADYRQAGARDVQMLRTAYEPTIHFPPPVGWSDADRSFDVVFIGAPYDERAQFMLDLWHRHDIPVSIWGSPEWSEELPADARRALLKGTQLWIKDYRETIWRSRICLSFVTHSNCDDVAQKSFEIAASGGFLLAEDSKGHREHFSADNEAVFFQSAADCADKVRRFLADEAARTRIAAAGHQRAVASGYGNDARIARVLDYVAQKIRMPERSAPGST